jgi:putative flippase GtrA
MTDSVTRWELSSPWTHRLRQQVQTHASRSPRYLIVSVICAVVYNGIMIGLDRVGVHYALAQAASAAVLLPLGYVMQAHLTFSAQRSWRDFARYSAALITNYPVGVATLWLLCDVLRLDMVWASPISMVVLFVWNYVTSVWAFSRRRKNRGTI